MSNVRFPTGKKVHRAVRRGSFPGGMWFVTECGMGGQTGPRDTDANETEDPVTCKTCLDWLDHQGRERT